MKMVLIAYSEGIDEEVSELLLASSVQSYTKWTKVLGEGKQRPGSLCRGHAGGRAHGRRPEAEGDTRRAGRQGVFAPGRGRDVNGRQTPSGGRIG